jgi:hypothetical protein
MIPQQLNRIKEDYIQLEYYIQKLRKEGNQQKVDLFERKREFMLSQIQSLTQKVA